MMYSQTKEYGLNVHMIGFKIQKDHIKGDEITIHVSNRPETYRSIFTVPVKTARKMNHIFYLNVNLPIENVDFAQGQTESILFSFFVKDKLKNEKKIAIAKIPVADFPKINDDNCGTVYGEIIDCQILQSSKEQKKEFYKARENGFIDNFEITEHNTIKRKSLGHMKVQLSLCQPYTDLKEVDQKDENIKTEKVPSNEKDYSYYNEDYNQNSSFSSFKNKNIFKSKNNDQYEKFC